MLDLLLSVLTTSFQSSPTSKGGRYLPDDKEKPAKCCFNPRPPRKVGATKMGDWKTVQIDVSILAHLERWALRGKQRHRFADIFVSILAHLERWALRHPQTLRHCRPHVSILAHLERWALLEFFPAGFVDVEFQSSPTSKGGRYTVIAGSTRATHLFQSSPTSKGGRYAQRIRDEYAKISVSILAHLERWALLRCS